MPLDKNTDIGAINSKTQLQKIESLVQVGIDEGAEMFQPACPLPSKGFFYRPTVLTGVAQSSRVAQEEIFGPVLSVLTFRTPEEALTRANNTPYGLSAGIWTDKGSRILEMASKLRAGVIWANTYNKSGRHYPVFSPKGDKLLANACKGSRKDIRNAVVAARKAFAGWSARTAFHRGQIMYRIAEAVESRAAELSEELTGFGLTDKQARAEVIASVETLVYYAGWADKYCAVLGSVNPVAGPFYNFSFPEPTGVVGIVARAYRLCTA